MFTSYSSIYHFDILYSNILKINPYFFVMTEFLYKPFMMTYSFFKISLFFNVFAGSTLFFLIIRHPLLSPLILSSEKYYLKNCQQTQQEKTSIENERKPGEVRIFYRNSILQENISQDNYSIIYKFSEILQAFLNQICYIKYFYNVFD